MDFIIKTWWINTEKMRLPKCIKKGQTYEEVFGGEESEGDKAKAKFSIKGKKKSEEHIRKIRENRKYQIFPKKDYFDWS